MDVPLRILMLEDLKEDIWLVERALAKDGLLFELVGADTREEFIEQIDVFKPDVILSDHSLPQFNSKEALKICQQRGLDIPFILVTGTVSEEFAVTCIKEGATDYVLKSNLSRLSSSIRQSLKQRDDERQRKDVEQKIRIQNEELLKINGELDNFVYNVSHNLRAPLLSALGLVKLAKIEFDRSDTSTIPFYCNKIEESILKLDETLKEILDYSRNARSEIAREKIDLWKIIDDCFAKMQYLPHFDEIEKDITIDQQVSFFSDLYRTRVIFNNLISNALKYHDTSKKKRWIKIHASIGVENAHIVIEDNGIGIDPPLVSRIFDMFYRATEKSQGSGLGLYIVKEDIEKLGGKIHVSSQLREGTRFEITLPNQSRFKSP